MRTIDHHRTGKVHGVKEEQPDIGTETLCGIILPHSPRESEDDIDCQNCIRTRGYQ